LWLKKGHDANHSLEMEKSAIRRGMKKQHKYQERRTARGRICQEKKQIVDKLAVHPQNRRGGPEKGQNF